MAKPMFFYTGIYDNVADADADYEAIKSLHRGRRSGRMTPRSSFTRPTGT